MKNLTLLLVTLFLFTSCKKENETQAVTAQDSKEVSLVQDVTKLKNENGEEVAVTYFAEGGQVAVKIQKTGGKEQKLSAKTTSLSGNPVFANDEVMWEMTRDGKAGKLTDKAGNSSEYK